MERIDTSNFALERSSRVFHRFRLSNSICMLDQKDSIIALSKASPTDPKEGKPGVADPFGERPRGELRPVVRMNDRTSFDPTLLDGHVEGVDDEVGVLARVDGPTNNAS